MTAGIEEFLWVETSNDIEGALQSLFAEHRSVMPVDTRPIDRERDDTVGAGEHRDRARIRGRVTQRGAIVFDHYATVPDFIYTLGERMAADEVLTDRGLLHLHDTGVFVKLGS